MTDIEMTTGRRWADVDSIDRARMMAWWHKVRAPELAKMGALPNWMVKRGG